MRYRAKDKSYYKPLVEDWKKRWVRGKKFPYVIFGFIGTTKKREKKDGKDIVKRHDVPRIHTLKGGANFESEARIQKYLNMGFEIIEAYFPDQKDLPPLRKDALQITSTWELGLRADAGYFLECKQLCEDAKNSLGARVGILEKEKAELLEQVKKYEEKLKDGKGK